MDPGAGAYRISRKKKEDDDEERRKRQRPPSSYGSMKSDSDGMEEEEGHEEELAAILPNTEPTAHGATGLQLIRSESPETLYTMTTEQHRSLGDAVIDTRSNGCDQEDSAEDDEEDMGEDLFTNSPEPPEPFEPDDTMPAEDNSQSGRLHPEQDLPHIFKSIQSSLTGLTWEELYKVKTMFLRGKLDGTWQNVMEGDLLDFVDRILEIYGQDHSLMQTISTLEIVNKKAEADELRNQCRRALIRFQLKQDLIQKHRKIYEGVVRAGRHNLLNTVYVEPQISTCGYGGVDPFHQLRPHPPSPPRVPGPDTFVHVDELFRLQKADGSPVRTVLTTGIPGIGMSVSVGKFALDWAEMCTYKDLQFVIKLSFRTFWLLRNKSLSPSQKMSIMEVIEYLHPVCKGMKYLEEEDCKFLIIMDSFDCYQAPLDWESAPVINDNYTQAHPDVLIVNIIRGTVLRGARVWILGRRAAVSQIPSQFVDVVTEIQGFSDEMKDDYLKRRFSDPSLAANIVRHYKRLPTLRMLARQPFICWMVATVFERCFRYRDYGMHPPRLTPFYINVLIVQTNRRLQFYYGKGENDLKWSNDDKQLLTKMGEMAFKMLERNTSMFYEEDVKDCGLELTEVTVWSGLCTELPAAASDGRRTFCFIHFTFQEFMAALYVFMMFYTESDNILDSWYVQAAKILVSRYQTKSAAVLVQCALLRTLNSPPGIYDMFLRFLCGMLSPGCHSNQLCGHLYPHTAPKAAGVDEAQRLLEEKIRTAPPDRVENLKECLREMTQEDE